MSIGAAVRRRLLPLVLLIGAVLLGVVSLTVAGVATPAVAVSTSVAPHIRTADLDDFSFDHFHVDFALGRDDERRSTLNVTERFDARFPDYDQNRGFIREIPRVYAGHTVDITVDSVVDETGASRPFTVSAEGDFVWITMAVPEGEFVRGPQTYVIDYSVRDVTRYFGDTGVDEFYWDLNGTEWAQPFGEVSATLTVADDIAPAMTGDASCYRGELGSDMACTAHHSGNTVSVSESLLEPGENVSIAVAFTAGTFADAPAENYYETPNADAPGGFPFSTSTPLSRALSPGGVPLLLVAAPASFIAALVLFIVSAASGRKRGSGRAIIAQYEPPEGVSVAVAAEIVRQPQKSMTASLLDLAVRGNVRMVHDQSADIYGVQSVSPGGLSPIEAGLYDSVFGPEDAPGSTMWIDGKSTRLGDAAGALKRKAVATAKQEGYLVVPKKTLTTWAIMLVVLAFALPVLHSIITLNFMFLVVSVAVGAQILVWSLIGVVAFSKKRTTLSDTGQLLHDHLMGLREYIRLAEADRIRMLQSVSGAEVDVHRIVRIYERLLPYAVLFGYEREWQQELVRYYRESSPEWLAGDNLLSPNMSFSGFHSAVYAQPITRAASSSFGSGSGGSFSSFSGGSSGGGFSGGGGGGGGGRGI